MRPVSSPAGGVRLFVGLAIVALALRPQVIAIGPLLPAIRADLDVSHGVAGLLGTIPVLCMGIFAPVGPYLARALGPRLAIAACVGLIVAFGLLRTAVPGAVAVLAATVGIGLGMGTAGPILSIVVRLRARERPALATGAYAGGIVLGSALACAVAIPLAVDGTDWRRSLALLSLAGLASLGAWLLLVPSDSPAQRVDARPPRLPWGSATAWFLALVFGLQSLLYYGLVAWLPNVYVERGWSAGDAASLVALMNGVGLFFTVGVPIVADRFGSRRQQLLASALLAFIGLLGVIAVPGLGVAWAALLGVALGAIFPLVLTLPVDVADRPGDVGATAALMLLAGYVLSSTGPVVLGVVRDLTGDFGASLWALVALAVLLVASCWLLSPARLDRGVRRVEVSAP